MSYIKHGYCYCIVKKKMVYINSLNEGFTKY